MTDNIFNLDEAALFLLPIQTFVPKGDACAWAKQKKEWAKILFGANATGEEEVAC